MKALVIEPSRSYRMLLTKTLQNHDFDVVEVDDCLSCIDIIKETSFSLICLSMNLRSGDSRELCLQLRASPQCQHTPIIMLTSSYSTEMLRDYLSAGVTDLLRKQDYGDFDRYLSNFCQQFQNEQQSGGTILLIEDSATTAYILIEMLSSHNYSVDHYTRAEDALVQIEQQPYDLIVTDIVLEGQLSGTALTRSVRNHPKQQLRNIPIIAISSFSDSSRRIELFRIGVNDYVEKPVIAEEFLARISNLITSQQLLKALEKQQIRLQQMAMSDQLTGLYNRHYLTEAVPQRISQALRQSYPLSLIVIDIDYFKHINDQYGHAVGDKVLTAFAQLLKQQCRTEDIVARFGGEEFIIILDHCGIDEALQKAEKLRIAIMAQQYSSDLSITASFGVTTLLEDEKDFTTLFSRADDAVYQAKE